MPPKIAREVCRQATRWAPRETGGVLLGYPVDEAVLIEELVGAGPNAERETHRFKPDGPWQRERIAERYEASRRSIAYLGDWHSHPIGAGPSGLDRETARRIAGTQAAECPHPVFLIVTWIRDEWELRAYRLGKRRLWRMKVRIG